MKFDDILEKLPHATRLRVVHAALYFPRIAKGHGSLRDGKCNAIGCNQGPHHAQERLELAYEAMFGK